MNGPLILKLVRLAEADSESPLGPPDAAIDELIAANPEVARKWEMLLEIRKQLDDGEAAWGEVALAPGELLELLEGGVSDERAAELERVCWDSPAQLAELISNWRFLNGVHVECEMSPELRQRCMNLVRPLPVALPLPETPPQVIDEATERADRGDWESAERPMVSGGGYPFHSMHHNRSRRINPWVIVAVSVLTVATVVVLSFFMPSPFDRPLKNDSLVGPDQLKVPRSGLDQPQPESKQPTMSPSNDEQYAEGNGTPEPRMEEDPPDLWEPHEPLIVEHPPEPQRPEPHPPIVTPDYVIPMELRWKDIYGLVAAREGGHEGHWRGIEGQQTLSDTTHLVTLPDCWSMAEISTGGKLTMASDTEISLSRKDGTPDELSMLVYRGNVAVSGLNEGQRVHLVAGRRSWDATALRDDSAFAISILEEQKPLMLVADGEIQSGEFRIGKHEQIQFDGDELPTIDKAATSPAWLNAPKFDWSKRRAALASLRASTDLDRDLVRLFDKAESRQWATLWCLALNPEGSLSSALNHDSRTVRATALEVLRTVPRHDPRLQQLRKAMVHQLGADGASTVLGWVLAARARGLPKPAVRQSMLEGLTDRRLIVRHAAIFCLEQIYVRPFPRMHAPNYEMEHWNRDSVAAWNAYTQAIHEMVDGRQLRRGPPTQVSPRSAN